MLCSGNHQTTNCNNKENLKCHNCTYSNSKSKLKKDVNHAATDATKCKYLKYKLKSILAETDYPSKPDLPTIIGKTKITTNDITQTNTKTN